MFSLKKHGVTTRTNPIARKQSLRRKKAVFGGFFVVTIAVGALIAVSQLDKIREFFSRASGEEANIHVNTNAIIGKMPRPWRNLGQGGEAFDWRLQPLSAEVKSLKPEYIRIDHIYDFYEIVKGSPGNITFDFSKFDVILDDILATGAKPFISLSYMPPAISKGDIVDAPHNWSDWQLTIQKTIEHVSGTRGISDVYYEVWNEPDLFGGWKYYGDKNYLTMYSYAAAGANNASGVRPFKFGGPGITALYKNWFDALSKHALANNLRYDFFSWHRYNHQVDQYKKDMVEIRGWQQQFAQLDGRLELLITEWGHDSENHPGYDNAYGAAHTVAGAIEMVGVVDRAFVFEIQDGKGPDGKEYWGRWGVFTHKDAGAKAKPRYHALRMLDRIGDERVQVLGLGSWVKALAGRDEAGNIEVVLSNFDQYGKHAEVVPITFTGVKPGAYTVTKEYLNGQKTSEKVSTTAAELRVAVPMSANTVSFVELSVDGGGAVGGGGNDSSGGGSVTTPAAPTTNPAIQNGPQIQRRTQF